MLTYQLFTNGLDNNLDTLTNIVSVPASSHQLRKALTFHKPKSQNNMATALQIAVVHLACQQRKKKREKKKKRKATKEVFKENNCIICALKAEGVVKAKIRKGS